MSIRKAIIIRHGLYDPVSERLTPAGERQMRSLAVFVKQYLADEKNVLLLSSSAPRAEDSMEIISQEVGLPYQRSEYLWSDNETHVEIDRRALDYIKEMAEIHGADSVVIMTHLEYANNLPSFMARDSGNNFVPFKVLQKGQMIFIDFVERKHVCHTGSTLQ